ncbi:MAG: hypothetical protein K9W46_13165 [Candidatus Heimdallarchaeum endolithica]|uniref:4-vinyl reductase 4VR domain-containing protein n=1 Tax=Candidatus Heimdallarchaeum endolithica TaxID=2876572 RepID=A0A9Y1BS15_9ARCH|nr:MAG: hypothetical protein K9W46_13165 [Candidatus Heimdallarchaeum endolithica]
MPRKSKSYMIKAIYIFHLTGLPVFKFSIDKKQDIDEILFAGVSSAIDLFLKELGHSNLYAIQTEDGTLIYSSKHGLIFVVHAFEKDDVKLGQFLVKQIEIEFLKDFSYFFQTQDITYIEKSIFETFELKAQKLYDQLYHLYQTNPEFFNIFDPNLPLSILLESVKLEKGLLDGYPERTAKLARELYSKYDEKIKKNVLESIGKYFGYKLAKKRYSKKLVISPKEIYNLLSEISVVDFDEQNNQFIMKLCPICRGYTSEEPMCNFFTGFIEGALNNPKINVKETECRAKGDINCKFTLVD